MKWIDPQDPDEPISDQISFITCDASAYADNIDPLDAVASSIEANVSAIVLYSTSSNYCNYTADPKSRSFSSYRSIFKIISPTNASSVESYVRNSGNSLENVTILQASDSDLKFNEVSSSSSGTPSTAVAMTVLYSITAVITALFIAIIATGIIRAHRHPERYGPRNGEGQERRSRAKGIARAVLDTLPIVKFGGERGSAKPGDVEMVDQQRDSYQQLYQGRGEEVEGVRDSGRREREHEFTHEATAVVAVSNGSAAADGLTREQPTSSTGDGLDSVTSPQQRPTGDVNEAAEFSRDLEDNANVGMSDAEPASERKTGQQNARKPAADTAPSCSICTDDFAMGEDIRVLPCDHKFHPACVDPWLLNVSGTCPLW